MATRVVGSSAAVKRKKLVLTPLVNDNLSTPFAGSAVKWLHTIENFDAIINPHRALGA